MAYLLDANVFIQAKNLHYGFDFCPAFWDWIDRENAATNVFSIEKVGDELRAGADDLATWAEQRGTGLFLLPDASMLAALASVSAWVTTPELHSIRRQHIPASCGLLSRRTRIGARRYSGHERSSGEFGQ